MTSGTQDEPEVVHLARAAVERFNAGDYDGLYALMTEDVVTVVPELLPNSGTYRGKEGFAEMVRAWMEAWETFRLEPLAYRVHGEHLVVPMRQVVRGRGSGIEVAGDIVYVATSRDGRISSWGLYATMDDALADLAE